MTETDNFDLYDDLDQALIQPLDKEVSREKAEQEKNAQQLQKLQDDLKKLEEDCKKERETKTQLLANFACFTETAKTEMDRKDNQLRELRRELDELIFRKTKFVQKKTCDKFSQTYPVEVLENIRDRHHRSRSNDKHRDRRGRKRSRSRSRNRNADYGKRKRRDEELPSKNNLDLRGKLQENRSRRSSQVPTAAEPSTSRNPERKSSNESKTEKVKFIIKESCGKAEKRRKSSDTKKSSDSRKNPELQKIEVNNPEDTKKSSDSRKSPELQKVEVIIKESCGIAEKNRKSSNSWKSSELQKVEVNNPEDVSETQISQLTDGNSLKTSQANLTVSAELPSKNNLDSRGKLQGNRSRRSNQVPTAAEPSTSRNSERKSSTESKTEKVKFRIKESDGRAEKKRKYSDMKKSSDSRKNPELLLEAGKVVSKEESKNAKLPLEIPGTKLLPEIVKIFPTSSADQNRSESVKNSTENQVEIPKTATNLENHRNEITKISGSRAVKVDETAPNAKLNDETQKVEEVHKSKKEEKQNAKTEIPKLTKTRTSTRSRTSKSSVTPESKKIDKVLPELVQLSLENFQPETTKASQPETKKSNPEKAAPGINFEEISLKMAEMNSSIENTENFSTQKDQENQKIPEITISSPKSDEKPEKSNDHNPDVFKENSEVPEKVYPSVSPKSSLNIDVSELQKVEVNKPEDVAEIQISQLTNGISPKTPTTNINVSGDSNGNSKENSLNNSQLNLSSSKKPRRSYEKNVTENGTVVFTIHRTTRDGRKKRKKAAETS